MQKLTSKLIPKELDTFPLRNNSNVFLCAFGARASTDELLPVKYETVKCDKYIIFFRNLSITLAVMILSTKMRHNSSLATLQA